MLCSFVPTVSVCQRQTSIADWTSIRRAPPRRALSVPRLSVGISLETLRQSRLSGHV